MSVSDLVQGKDLGTDFVKDAGTKDVSVNIGAGLTRSGGQIVATGSSAPAPFTLWDEPVTINAAANTWVTKLTGISPAVTAGLHILTVSYGWNHNSQATDFTSRLLIDGVGAPGSQGGVFHRQEPKDSAGNVSGTGTDQQFSFTRVLLVTLAAGDTPQFDLQFRPSVDGNSSMWSAFLMLQKVA